MQARHLLFCLLAGAALSACERTPGPAAGDATATAPAGDAGDARPASPTHAFSDDIDAGDFAELVKTLSSDAFEGRGPGTPGGEEPVEYIKSQFERIGLQPGSDGAWFQDVPMSQTTPDGATVVKLDVDGKATDLKCGDDVVLNTRSGQAEVKVEDRPLVFVGYGVD